MKTIRTLCFLSLVWTAAFSFSHLQAEPKKEKPSTAPTPLLLESIGTLSAQGVYLTYMSIGALSDGFVAQVYDKEAAQSIMTSYVHLSKICQTQLSKLLKEGNLSSEDKKYIREIEITYGHLINQGQAIIDYIESSDQTHLKTFESNRLEAGKRIEKLIQQN
ncbi:hypothetical protein [Leptospira idonii]|uniref:DUF4168 domain-containing protein n=1 Tax=Leptospira idonii TaxID=1193500 RepID=A0A4V3JXQ9_9LEPT|nr:hypothetical protein [Leptospira idonii]TGN17578.1 hypothetical protein EHS15_16205 [Leptospira idonii]